MALFTNVVADNSKDQDRDNLGYLYLPVPDKNLKPPAPYDSNNTFLIKNPNEKYRVIGNPRRPEGGIETLKIDYSSFPKGKGGILYYGEFNNKARSGLFFIQANGSQRNSSVGINFSGITRFEIQGTPNDDEIRGAENDDILNGGEGNDTILVQSGRGDKVDGGKGVDTLVFNFQNSPTPVQLKATNVGSGTLSNGAEITTIKSIEVINVTTGAGDDYIEWFGSVKGSTIKTNDGNDTIISGSSNDFLNGGNGNDSLEGGVGNDTLIGGNGNDVLEGGEGNDVLIGVAFPTGNSGRNEIDVLTGGSGSDTFYLGDAARVFYTGGNFSPPKEPDVLTIEQLKAALPQISDETAKAFLKPLNDAMKEFGITTKKRQAAFLAQVGQETLDLRHLTEQGGPFSYDPYRGRGIIQITFKENYKQIGDLIGEDLVQDADGKADYQKVADNIVIACRAGAAFWNIKRCNELADKDNFFEICKTINGINPRTGLPNGYQDRLARWDLTKKVFLSSGWQYDNDHAFIKSFNRLEDTIVLHGKKEDYYLVNNHPVVGTKEALLQDLNQTNVGAAGGLVDKNTVIVREMDFFPGLTSGDDVIGIIRGIDNLSLSGNYFFFS